MRVLLDVPGLEGMSDAVRLAVVVLAARTPSETGVVEIRAGELARWLGLSASYVASDVLPVLRRSGVVSVDTAHGEYGQDNGLECKVRPLWAAKGVIGHPLALAKKEFATLLRLVEAVMAPGWTHRDGRVTPAGLIGTRTGRGAATDRLALLLLVLAARETGRVRQCGGVVDTKRGRAAATVARLLGCTASAGERVLERLEDRRLVQRVRVHTASGLAHRTRLIVPAVAAAHGQRGASVASEDRATAFHLDCSDRDVAAEGSEASDSLAKQQVSGLRVVEEAGVTEPDVAAALHTDHSSLRTAVSSPTVSGGFSGEGRGGSGDRPECAREREELAVASKAGIRLPLDGGAGGPLRGEQQQESPVTTRKNSGCGPVVGTKVRVLDGASQGRRQRGRVPLPPENLRVILAPVRLVWARLERPAGRRLVEAATRTELARLSGLVGRTAAPNVLADRLARRLEDQMRLGGPIQDPVGWLVGRGLPQRQECGDVRCDEGLRLDTGGSCATCDGERDARRHQRHTVAAAVDAAMPYASFQERRAATERRLHEAVTAQAWARELRWEQQCAQKAAAAKDRAEAAAARTAAGEQAARLAPVVLPGPRPAPADPAPEPEADVVDQEMVLEELTREQVLEWRTRAACDHQVVFDHIDRYGEVSARRLFTGRFVDQVQRLSGLGHLDLGYTPWGSA
ncbi:hypothetical protein [Streptomyces sp. NPDC007856]|uniref:hypothetical protein n=1 Tax=Streptomyces sp. NPDC007856 TaxID=3364781 RepID=UPI0036B223A6